MLCRLGYKVRNDVLVPVPIYRSRTAMVDVVIDLAAIPAAALRVQRRRPACRQSRCPAWSSRSPSPPRSPSPVAVAGAALRGLRRLAR